jgi:hypothetical protein
MKGERIEVKLNSGHEPFAFQNEALVKGCIKIPSISSKSQGDHPICNSSIAVVEKKLYVRLDQLLSPDEIAIFDSNSLTLLEIRDFSKIFESGDVIVATEDENSSSTTTNLPENIEMFEFDLNAENEVLIRSSSGYQLSLKKAIVDDQYVVTESLLGFFNEKKTSFYHENISDFVKGFLVNHQDLAKLTLEFELIQLSNKQKLNLPITSCGQDLVLIRSLFAPSLKARKAYNIMNDITIISVTDSKHEETNNAYPEHIAKQWKAYLRTMHTSHSGTTNAPPTSTLAEFAQQDWEELMKLYAAAGNADEEHEDEDSDEDTEDDDSSSVLKNELSFLITYKIGSHSPSTVVFGNKNCDYSKLLEKVEDYYSAGMDIYHAEIFDIISNQVVTSIPLKCPEKSKLKDLDNASLLYNGYQLIITVPDFIDSAENPEQIMNKMWTFNTVNHAKNANAKITLENFSKKKYLRSMALPVFLNYDCRGNNIWGFDPFSNNVVRWRNVGLAPVNASLYSRDKGLLYQNPSFRLENLKKSLPSLTAKQIASLLLVLLEKLGEPYLGQINQSDSESFHKIKMSAKAFENPNLGEQKCSLTIQNIPVFFEDEEREDHTGEKKILPFNVSDNNLYFLSPFFVSFRISFRNFRSSDSSTAENKNFR